MDCIIYISYFGAAGLFHMQLHAAIYPPSPENTWLRKVKRGRAVNLNLIKCRSAVEKSPPAADLFSRFLRADNGE